MKMMVAIITMFGFSGTAHAEETLTEKTQVKVKSVSRSAKKGSHRLSEAVCGKLTGDNKVECLAKQAKNRLQEGKDVVVDKADEVKNAVDSDHK